MADPLQDGTRREPREGAARRSAVLRSLMVLLALALVGCGSTDEGGSAAPSASPSASPSVSPSASAAACPPATDAAPRPGTLARVDLDGDGTADQVATAGAGDPCPGQLQVTLGDRAVAVPLPDRAPPVRAVFGVVVPGRDGQLLVTRQDHPRGGFQTRVFALDEDRLVELEGDQRPLVPFVATDVQEQPVSIDCVDGGVAVTRAVAHEPAGVVFAWDVRRTTYSFDGATLKAGVTKEIADNVLPGKLRTEYPELEKNAVFPSCRAPSAD